MEGVFGLDSDNDLQNKLEWEYENLSKDLDNPFIAYNYFVTAWHILEWKYPDPNGTELRKKIRDGSVLLQICEHIAIGAKHFCPTKKSLNSVKSSDKSGVWGKGTWAPGVWADGTWATWLEVRLDGLASEKFGDIIKVADLAKFVIEFWRSFDEETYT